MYYLTLLFSLEVPQHVTSRGLADDLEKKNLCDEEVVGEMELSSEESLRKL